MFRLFSIARRVIFALLPLLTFAGCGGGSGTSNDPVTPVAAPSALAYPGSQTYTVGVAITPLTPTVTGTVSSYSVFPALPEGLALNATSGQIAGTPTAAAGATSYTITAQNSGGSTTAVLSITVNAAPSFLLEPATGTTIGVGQSINLFGTFKSNSTDPYPVYIDPAKITWSSSQPGFAVIDSSAIVTGVNEGTTTITAQYLTYSKQITVSVAGTFVQRSVNVPGQGNRQYSIYTPPFGSSVSPHALILSLHGGGGSAMIQASTSLLPKLAFDQQIYVAFLEGTGVIQTFNAGSCCGSAQTQNVDDVLYVQTVLDDILAIDNVNAAKVFATGFSNGGMMSHRLACSLASRFTAIAAVAGGAAEFDRSLQRFFSCNPTRPIPVLHIHSTNDRNYPFAGGVGDGLSSTDFYPIDSTIADWRVRNNVTAQAAIENVTATTTCYRYSIAADTSKASAPVVLCKENPTDIYDSVNKIVFGGGHSWPGGVRSPAANSDAPLTDFNANAYLWMFFNE